MGIIQNCNFRLTPGFLMHSHKYWQNIHTQPVNGSICTPSNLMLSGKLHLHFGSPQRQSSVNRKSFLYLQLNCVTDYFTAVRFYLLSWQNQFSSEPIRFSSKNYISVLSSCTMFCPDMTYKVSWHPGMPLCSRQDIKLQLLPELCGWLGQYFMSDLDHDKMGENLANPLQNSPIGYVLNLDSVTSALRLYFRPVNYENTWCGQSQTLSELAHRICFEYGLYNVSCSFIDQ